MRLFPHGNGQTYTFRDLIHCSLKLCSIFVRVGWLLLYFNFALRPLACLSYILYSHRTSFVWGSFLICMRVLCPRALNCSLHIGDCLVQSAQAALIEFCRLGGVNSRFYSFTVLEAKSPRSGSQQGWPADNCPLRVSSHSSFSMHARSWCLLLFLHGHQFFLITAPPFWPHLNVILSLKALSPNTITLGVSASARGQVSTIQSMTQTCMTYAFDGFKTLKKKKNRTFAVCLPLSWWHYTIWASWQYFKVTVIVPILQMKILTL